jgi:Gpi18-like mannosyltransferase
LERAAGKQRNVRERRAAEAGDPARAWRDVVVVWAASRAFFLVCGALGHAFLSPADSRGVAYREPPGVLSYWANWDGAIFTHIAQHGCDTITATPFLPLYPLAVRAVTALGPGLALAGVLVSTAASLVALSFGYELAAHWWNVRVARAATLALAFFPTAFFLNAAYSESLFLALTSGSLWALYVRRDLLMAGVFGYFAATTRSAGVMLLIPLASEFLQRRRETGWGAIGVAGPPLGLLTYASYLHLRHYRALEFARLGTRKDKPAHHDQAGLGSSCVGPRPPRPPRGRFPDVVGDPTV